jgi:hypothetical protein
MNFPNEILNLIFSYIGPTPIVEILKPEINKYLSSNEYQVDMSFKEFILRQNINKWIKLQKINKQEKNNFFFERHLRSKTQPKINENRLLPRILYSSLSNEVLNIIKCKSDSHPNSKIINELIKRYNNNNNNSNNLDKMCSFTKWKFRYQKRRPHPIAKILKPEILIWQKYYNFCYFFTFKQNEYIIINRNCRKYDDKLVDLMRLGYYGGRNGDIY